LAGKTKEFSVIEPDDITFALDEDDPPGSYDIEEKVYMGCQSYFTYHVGPRRVSFSQVHFRENKQVFQFAWPDGTLYTYIPGDPYVPWVVDDDNSNPDGLRDRCADAYRQLRRTELLNDDDDESEVFEAAWSIPEEYQGEGGGWICWLPDETHAFQYTRWPGFLRGSARAGIRTGGGECFGGWMGPFKTIDEE
jgi:hypothetical protein